MSYNWEPNEANQSEKQIQSAILRIRKDDGNKEKIKEKNKKEKKGEEW